MKTTDDIQKMKGRQKIVAVTAYDFAMASYIDAAGVDIILVGDSAANVVLGMASTREITLDAMTLFTAAVARAAQNALVVADMPYEGLTSPAASARRLMEAGCKAVKLEWAPGCETAIQAITEAKIPLMGHVGLTPQTADALGGMKVQGRDAAQAREILNQARTLEKLGAFSVVLECVPAELAREITSSASIPTIGIGAGVHCDGQVLVAHDLLGLYPRKTSKFVKQYARLGEDIKTAVTRYITEVRDGAFPDDAHSFH